MGSTIPYKPETSRQLNNGNNDRFVDKDPLRICLGADFQESGTIKRNSKQCQAYLAQHCAESWDNVCEFLSGNEKRGVPNLVSLTGREMHGLDMPAGVHLVRNAAQYKYSVAAGFHDNYTAINVEPFDYNVPNSPDIVFFTKPPSHIVFDVPDVNLDQDPVMNKMLNSPENYMDIFVGIYRTRKGNNTLGKLGGTRLGSFFNQPYFQKIR